MNGILNTLGPKASQQGTTSVASTHGKAAPALATQRGTQGAFDGALGGSQRGYQDPTSAGSEPVKSVSPGGMAK